MLRETGFFGARFIYADAIIVFPIFFIVNIHLRYCSKQQLIGKPAICSISIFITDIPGCSTYERIYVIRAIYTCNSAYTDSGTAEKIQLL